ncbi:hypothetical protein [Niallia sp. RD1]|nr:hypothetical protein [Niallia sp. RD1]UTI40738.1 hypothetical protein NKG37_17795 [Niallia sp. RD1]
MKTIYSAKARKRSVHKQDENHFSAKVRKRSVHKQDENHFLSGSKEKRRS